MAKRNNDYLDRLREGIENARSQAQDAFARAAERGAAPGYVIGQLDFMESCIKTALIEQKRLAEIERREWSAPEDRYLQIISQPASVVNDLKTGAHLARAKQCLETCMIATQDDSLRTAYSFFRREFAAAGYGEKTREGLAKMGVDEKIYTRIQARLQIH